MLVSAPILGLGFVVILSLLVSIIFIKRQLHLGETLSASQKAFMASRRIYRMIFEDLDFAVLAQKIADSIPNELEFGTGVLAILDEDEQVIRRIAASRTKQAQEAIRALSTPFDKIEISIYDPRNLMAKSLREHKSFVTNDVYDVLGPVLTREETRIIQNIMGTKTTLVYPIFLKNKPIGVFLASTQKDQAQLSSYEFDIIEDFVHVSGILLQNSKLYTSLKKTTEQLQQANERLKQLDKLKDDFVSIASHELRTPMTAIKSYVWMALNKPDITLSEKMKKYLSRTLISTERLINLVNDMLNISRIESGRIDIKPQAFDLQTLADEVMSEVGPKAAEKTIHLNVTASQVPKVFADPDKIHQVLLNLVGNALKFTPAGGSITISFFVDGQMVETLIKDTGVGISKEDISRLFQKFGRLDNSYVAAATVGGTGLGLYISKKLIDLMHGKIWATSEGAGKGTTFIFALPIATPQILSQAEKYTQKALGGEAKTLEPVAI